MASRKIFSKDEQRLGSPVGLKKSSTPTKVIAIFNTQFPKCLNNQI
jgi:hypothetical protein